MVEVEMKNLGLSWSNDAKVAGELKRERMSEELHEILKTKWEGHLLLSCDCCGGYGNLLPDC